MKPDYPTIVSKLISCAALVVLSTNLALSAPPSNPSTSQKFDYDITVPLFHNGQNVGSTVIPKGEPVEVVSETATTITIRHMGNVLTIAKPGKANTKVTAQPTAPKVGAYPEIDPVKAAKDAEITRMSKIPRRTLPYPIMRVEIQSDGSYAYTASTLARPYSFEKAGETLKMLQNDKIYDIWEVNDTDTVEAKIKSDPKLATFLKEQARNLGGDAYIPGLIAQQMRVIVTPSKYAIPKNTPLKEVLGLIATGDPRMQSLIDYADKETSSSLRKEHIAPQCARVGIREIAKELMDDKTPDEAISLRDDFEKMKVTHRAQIGNTCEIYSAYHMLDYYMKKGVITPFSFEQFRSMATKYGPANGSRNGISINGLLELLHAIQPDLKIQVREMYPMSPQGQTSFEGGRQIFRAFVQHELAKGRPLWISTGDHSMVGVGLQGNPSDTLITLDSTGFSTADHGYRTQYLHFMWLATSLKFTK